LSQANIPNITPSISVTFNDAVNLLLISIAMEELGLAHILNAEGEKLQYVLGTLPGATPMRPSVADLLAINSSLRQTIREVAKKEWLLQSKLENVILAMERHSPVQ